MKTVLAFGDSNTYGLNPRDGSRFDAQTRWTGILQKQLAPFGVQIAEEGLCGRTTVFPDPLRPDRRGIDALPHALAQHRPDLVILMLGTNDCKTVFHASPDDIADGIRRMIGVIRAQSQAEVLLLSPIRLEKGVYEAGYDPDFNADSVQCSVGLKESYAALAKTLHCRFLAASDYAAPSKEDCEHMDETGHRALADALGSLFLSGSLL